MSGGDHERCTFEYSPDVRINYEIHGSGSTPAVLLHGFGASLETWRDILPHLGPHLLSYTVDLKGFGLSSKPDDGRYSIADQASVIAAFIEKLGLRGICLVGHSMGGAVALLSCLKLLESGAPDRVSALVLIAAPVAPQHLPFFIEFLRSPVSRSMVHLLPTSFQTRYVLRQIWYDPRGVTPERVERYARFVRLPGSLAAMAATARQIVPRNRGEIAEGIRDIRVPALLLWGDHDRVVFRWQAGLLQELLPDTRLSVLSRCGHIPQEERPEETACEILGFLGSLRADLPGNIPD